MILEKQTEAHILQEGESQDTVKMSLDLDSAQVLMQMLSKNLYSDSIGSTIRECASNALDSHRRAGSDKPIIVSFKRNNQADTYEFAVEDFGIGLDADDVVNIISKYGKSTKRDSNTELGMMGLGFKAPLAYSSSFYFVARKNGMERKYMMYEGEDTNSIDLLYEKPTTEGNGVKVIVPVNYYDRYNFTQKIKEQLAYFENVYFDVDQSIGHSVSNDFVIYRAEHFQFSSMATNNSMHLCLDNVSYPIDWEKLGIDRINIKIALRFSLSDGLFPTPNREAIRYTQEAKQVILKKIAQVADVFMEKFNESISDNANIDAVMSFYGERYRYLPSFYRKDEDKVQIDELIKHATIPMKQPKMEGIELLDLQRMAEKNKEYILSEYQIKYRYQGNRFNNAKNYWTTNLRLQDLNSYNSGKVYVFSDRLTKTKQDYMRSLLGDNSKCHLFVKKDKPFTLMNGEEIDYNKYYHSVLGLKNYPKSQWRQLIKEFQYIISLYAKDFIDVDAIEIPQDWMDAQKAKRMKVLASPVTVNGVKKVRMKGEFSGKVGTATEIQYSDRYAKFVPTTFKLEDVHKVNKLHVYGKEDQREKLDKLWSCFNKHANFVIVAQATIDNLQKADLHNWITIDKFMEGKNRPFKTMATQFLVEELVRTKRATFQRINVVTEISKDLGDKLNILDEYNRLNTKNYADDTTKNIIIEHATQNNLFDQPIYMVYKQVNEVFTKLPFLNVLMDKMGYRENAVENPMMQAVVDLFKYHKQKVNLQHYTIKLTEDAVLEETLTEDTINELQTI
jgi:hypothetical protein